ncbi:MAG TPA: right-handed parallel beta-helix repeat-containing protein, partial [Tepidisphaeraceae bacterium]|nr:right-handed parallel beta-helix repeat-containing protein [Tepidisphaeraceae bacterium]
MNESKPRPCASLFSLDPLENRRFLSVGLNANGWTVVDASPDTRRIYVSSSIGNDLNTGFSPSSPLKTIAAGIALLRNGMPDWILLKRGDSWSGEGLGSWSKSGRSAEEPMLISAYGSGERPLLNTGAYNGFYTQNDAVNNLDIIGIHFYADTRDPNSPTYVGPDGGLGIRWLVGGTNLLIEDCDIDSYATNIDISAAYGPISNVSLRRNIITDAYTITGHSQGAIFGGIDGLTLEGNVFDHNGWNEQIADAEPTVFNHNIYIVQDNKNVIVKDNIIANAASHGLQARSGGQISGNIFINNPIGLSFGLVNGSHETDGGVTGFIKDNIFLGSRDINGAVRGYVMEIDNVKPGGTVISGNIMVGNAQSLNPAIQLSYGTYAGAPSGTTGINDLTIENNVLYNWASALWIDSRMVPGSIGSLALNNLTVRNNDFQMLRDPQMIVHGPLFNSAQEHFAANRYYSTQPVASWFSVNFTTTSFNTWKSSYESTAVNTQVGYPDSTRTIATYNATLGGATTAAAFITEARKQSQINWRAGYTSSAIGDYFEQGYNAWLPAVIVTPTSPLQTSETGGTATFQVVLSTQPTANVLVPISSSNTGEASVSSSVLTFTTANWNLPQTVTVTGIDDSLIDQDASYNVVIAPSQSTDVNYNGLNAADLTLVNKAIVPIVILGGLALGLEGSPYSLSLSALQMGTVSSWSINWGDGVIQPV